VAQGVNVLRCETKVRKLFIIKLSEPRPYALLPGIVVSLNKSTHQARSGFQVLGRAGAHASPQRLKVHDRLLCVLQRESEVRTRVADADVPSWWRRTPYVVHGARARLRDFALQLSNLAEKSVTRAATSLPFPRREYGL
jgi:hypothetical protein